MAWEAGSGRGRAIDALQLLAADTAAELRRLKKDGAQRFSPQQLTALCWEPLAPSGGVKESGAMGSENTQLMLTIHAHPALVYDARR